MSRSDPLAEKTARLRAARLERDKAQRPYIAKRPVHQLMHALPFGKHKGKLLRDVIDEDHGWIVWAQENIADFEISEEAQTELDLMMDVRRPPKAWRS